MSARPKPWVVPLLGFAAVLVVISGASPVHWYSSTIEHDRSTISAAEQVVERRPIVTTVWSTGLATHAVDALGLQPDLLVRARRLDWSGNGWTPLWKSGTLRYELDAQVFGGTAQGGLDLQFEGELRATFRGLCSPALAREVLEERLHGHVLTEVRVLAGA